MLDAKKKLTKYVIHSEHYLNNAGKFLQQGDIGKSSELLWGSFAEAIKAVALSKGTSTSKHWQIGNFTKELSKELQDDSFYNTYIHANSLHKNFYEIEIDIDDVRRIAENIRATVGKLIALIPPDSFDLSVNRKTR